MWFKNACVYNVKSVLEADPSAIEQALAAFKFNPCTSQEAVKIGFTNPLHEQSGILHRRVNGIDIFAIKKQEKILPAAVINEELQPKIAAMEAEKCRPLSRKEKQVLKEELIQELLPRAMVKSKATTAFYCRESCLLVVDTASFSTAETFLALLRKSFGSLPVVPLFDNHQLNQQMHFWLQGKSLPEGFTLGSSAALKAPDEEGAKVKFTNHLLSADEVQSHLQDKLVVELQLEQDEKVSFTIKESGNLAKIKFHDLLCGENEELGWDDTLGRLDADFILMSGQLKDSLAKIQANLAG